MENVGVAAAERRNNMRQEIKNAYGSDVGKFYDKALKTVRKRPSNSDFKVQQVRMNYPENSLGGRSTKDMVTKSDQRVAERSIRQVQKDAAKTYTKKVAKETANKVAKRASTLAKVSKAAKLTPVSIIGGAIVEKGATIAADYGRKKFKESDNKRVSQLKKKDEAIYKEMEKLRNRGKKK